MSNLLIIDIIIKQNQDDFQRSSLQILMQMQKDVSPVRSHS